MVEKQQTVEKTPKKRLNLVLLCISAFFSQAAGYMVFAYLGPQAQNIFGAPTVVATLLPMSSSIVGLIGLIPVGIYVDRSGRRKEAILLGYAILTVFNILMALMTNWPEMLIFRTIGAGAQTLVMFLYTILFIFQLPEKRGMAIGLYMGLSTVGSTIFMIFSGAIIQSYGYYVITGYQMLFWVAALLGLLSIVFLAPVRIPVVKASNVTTKSFTSAIAIRGVWYAGLVWLVSGIGFLAFETGIPIILPKAPFNASSIFVGVVFAIVGLVSMIGMFIGGGLTDKAGPRRIMAISGIIGAAVSLLFLFASPSYLLVAIVFWVVIFFMGFGFAAPNTSATASVGPELAGTAVNTETLFFSIAGIVGGILSGVLLGIGFSTLAIVAAVVLLVSGLMAFGIPQIKKQEKH